MLLSFPYQNIFSTMINRVYEREIGLKGEENKMFLFIGIYDEKGEGEIEEG